MSGARRLIVDGNNVIGSRPDGWWRDRAGRGPAARSPSLQALAARGRRPHLGRARRPPAAPTCPKACTAACSSRTRPAPGATRPTTASSTRSRATATRRRSSSSPPTAASPSACARSAPRSKARARCSQRSTARRLGQRSGIGTPVTPSSRSHAHRVQRHRHEVVLADGEHEIEQLLCRRSAAASAAYVASVSALIGVQLVGGAQQASRRTDPSPARRARRRSRSISSSVTPTARAIATCWPHSYGARQFQPVRRMSSSRSRAEQRALREHVVAEHHPPLHQLRVVRERREDVDAGCRRAARASRRPTRSARAAGARRGSAIRASPRACRCSRR